LLVKIDRHERKLCLMSDQNSLSGMYCRHLTNMAESTVLQLSSHVTR
jgi:hypothetical protein